ncbi:sigma-70 family RNA polymerase sigma factor [Taibaiella koreensis]|uniref:sigma-70 family RNA polymerase sigma factor n=1 Tax=Taibaiella koreensis TaxID=1268548 RepID=UPI0013C334A7|nr:sigma-70 family RNA polymerase sigma factor [Taibaiella koreensis]
MLQADPIPQLTAHLFREHSGKMVAVLSRLFGLQQLDQVMDIVQDTFEAALTHWRFSGIPANPPAWLMQVARNKAINQFKKEQRERALRSTLQQTLEGFTQQIDLYCAPGEIKDSQLKLLLLCCHPSLSTRNQIALTLYVLCGFGVPEIANALLMQPEAAKKALTRSKALLREEESPFDPRPGCLLYREVAHRAYRTIPDVQ